MNKTGGCSPVTAFFTNTTTGASGAATYKWDFGNGSTSVIRSNVGSTFKEEKVYTVTLTVTDGGQVSSKQKTITVYKKPTVDFSSAPAGGCIPVPVSFTSSASAGDGSIASYLWDFGDGTTEEGANLGQISHTYDFPQTASVSLTVTNSFGCYATLEKPDIVDAKGGVKAEFTADKTAICNPSEVIKFQNQSTGTGTFSYLWEFGDGQTSTEKDPSHVYNSQGVYNVKLTVNSSVGCPGIVQKDAFIHVSSFTADFLAPQVSCAASDVWLVNKSVPVPDSSIWQPEGLPAFRSTRDSVRISFPSAGPKQVTLTNYYGTCREVVTKTVNISETPGAQPIEATFASECGAPATINFRDNTPGATSWEWNLDGDAANTTDATDQAPVFTYTRNGIYTVKLKVTNAAGCTDTVSRKVTIKTQVVKIRYTKTTSPAGGSIACEPFTMNFAVESTDDIQSYNWTLNDAPVSTEATPQLSFTSPGTYLLKLNYTTVSGCSGVATYSNIAYYEKPVVDFTSLSGTTICGNSPVNFQSTVISGTATQWRWSFGEPGGGTSNLANPVYKFNNEGEFTVSVTASNGGCGTKVSKDAYIKVLPPFPDIATIVNSCEGDRGTVTFTQASKQANTWEWDFGDGTRLPLSANTPQVKHTYASSGAYNVVLTTSNGQCVVKDSLTAYVLLKQRPTLTAARTQICSNESLQLTVAGLERNPYTPSPSYKLVKVIYGDGSTFNGTGVNPRQLWGTTHTATLSGFEHKDNLRAIVQAEQLGCYDTTNLIQLDIKGPIAAFDMAASAFCYNKPVVFTDKSRGTDNIAIKTWEWNFGDSTTTTLSSGGGTVPYSYAAPGSYVASLKVTDEQGCFAEFTSDTLQASGPKAIAAASDSSVMVKSTVNFFNKSVDNPDDTRYKWIFYNGTSTENNPSKKYNEGVLDTVKLVASSATTRCADTASVLVQVKVVNVEFTTATIYKNGDECPPLLARFTNTSVNVDSFYWDFGDGSAAGKQHSPSHTYEQPGLYRVTLHGYARGLEDSVWTDVRVAGPTAKLSADKFFGCMDATVTLKAEIKDAANFIWDMGDGTLKQIPDSSIVYHYSAPGVFQPALIVNDNSGCSATFELSEKIVVDSLAVSLANTGTRFCDSASITFTPDIFSVSADSTLTYRWDFGTGRAGDVSSLRNPSFMYAKPGSYNVKLQVESPFGCKQEASLPVKVFETPDATIIGPADACVETPVEFKGKVNTSEEVEWKWSFGNGVRPEVQNPEPQFFNEADTFRVRLVVKSHGCTDTARHNLAVHGKPRLVVTADKTTVCPEETVQLNAEGGSSRTWTPSRWLSDPTDRNPKAKPRSSILYKVTNVSQFGCTNTDSIRLVVVEKFDLVVKDTAVCTGKSIQLTASGGETYEWSAVNGAQSEISDIHSPSPVVTPTATSGYAEYRVKAIGQLGCFDATSSVRVKVNQVPTVDAGPPSVEVLAASEYLLQAKVSSDVTKWSWQPADYLNCATCPAPTAVPKQPITYRVRVMNQYGCEAVDSINVRLYCGGTGQVYIPNSFTPNYDGKNDVFYVKGRGISNIKSFQIFNRWGDVVFRKTNIAIDDRSAGWNGMYKDQLVPTGSYVYIVELQCGDEVFQQKGTVTVVY